ncbi:hypothetical protein CDEF62S_04607 [Castellaniella defragrans]
MGEPASQMTHQRCGEIDQACGQSPQVEQVARRKEEGDGEQ